MTSSLTGNVTSRAHLAVNFFYRERYSSYFPEPGALSLSFLFPMGSDNHTNRRWIYHPRRFCMSNSLRHGVKTVLFAIAVYAAAMLCKATPKQMMALGLQMNSTKGFHMSSTKEQIRDICKRKVYSIDSTCGQYHCYVIAVTVNMGFYDFFLNWYHYYHLSDLQSNNTGNAQSKALLVVIAEDDEVYIQLTKLQWNDVQIIRGHNVKESNSLAEDYDSVGYKSLVSGRASHLLDLLCGLQKRTGLIVVYTDIDTVWLRNPLPIIRNKLFDTQQHQPHYDILAAVDDHDFGGVETYYCTGFLVFTTTPATFRFLSQWEDELKTNPQLNQPIFNSLLKSDTSLSIQVRNAGLDEAQFPPGRLFFDNHDKVTALQQTVVVHNNYIIGRENKKKRFEEYGLWNVSSSYFL